MDKRDTLHYLAGRMADVVASPYSTFYRELYGVAAGSVPNLHTWDDWNVVPTFGKDVLLDRPMREYTFVPHKQVDTIYYTSGTSGKPPVFCPRVAYAGGFTYRKKFYDFPGAFIYSIKAIHRNDAFLRDMGSRSHTIAFDPKHVAACVLLAKAAGVSSLAVHTFTIRAIGDEMMRFNIAKDIELIDFVGETCSLMLYTYMRETFPNAKILSYYGLSEAESAPGMPCRPLSDEEPYPVFHPHPDFHIDIVDAATGNEVTKEAGAEGELVLTDLVKERAFPLVRYRPGDTARVVDTACKEHGAWTFTVLGKTASDFMLVPGGQLRADEVERVLRLIPQEVTDFFELHRYSGGTVEKPMLEVVLHVQTKKPQADLAALASTIAKELRVSPNRTYEDGVAAGIYAPLRCVELSKEDAGARKHRRMFIH